MKHNHNHNNNPNAGIPLVPVRFEFTDATATTFCLAGTFNHWQPEGKTLHSSGVGNWWKETALAPGTYEYCLVVDGKWIPDPRARESVANPFGGTETRFCMWLFHRKRHICTTRKKCRLKKKPTKKQLVYEQRNTSCQ